MGAPDPIRVGVVGPEDFVSRIIETAPMILPDIPPFQLVSAAYGHERESTHVVDAIRDSVDGLLFTGPVPHDIVRGQGGLDIPSAYIPLNGASLYGCMVVGSLQAPSFNPLQISVDTITNAEVHEAYEQLSLSQQNVYVKPYDARLGAQEMAEFHLEMHRLHGTTGALTGLRSVYEQLRASDVGVFRMVPTVQASRTALRIAVLLATGTRGAESRVVAVVIAIGANGDTLELEALTGRWGDSLLSAQQLIREEARRVGALATPLSASRMLVVCTPEAADLLFRRYSTNPFSGLLGGAGLDSSVGVGSAYDAAAAYDSAVAALKMCRAHEGSTGCAVLQDGSIITLGHGVASVQAPVSLSASQVRYIGELRRALLSRKLDTGASAEVSPIVGADDVGRVLGLSVRSARRLLDSLVDSGVAWALPSARGPQPGRPRRRWRIDLERPLRSASSTSVEDVG